MIGGTAKNPSYDKTLAIKERLADFLGKYHIILNGVTKHDPFMLEYEGRPNERCDYDDKKQIIEFVNDIFQERKKLENNVITSIGYLSNKLHNKTYKTSLKKWLTKKIEFRQIDHAVFSDKMVYAVVEFDKDHCIHILLEENVFKK